MTGSRILRGLMALAVVVAVPGARLGAQPGASAAMSLPSRQILVMIKTPPKHFRLGAGYGAGRYGDAASLAGRKRLAQDVARKNDLVEVDGWPMPLLGIDCYVMRIRDGTSVDAAVARVSRDSRVAWSEPMQLYQTKGSNRSRADPLYPIEPAARAWRLTDLHKVATGRGVSVAVIDSQVQVNHPDLAGHFIADVNFLNGTAPAAEQHGTAVAGIIGAQDDNGVGIAGIAPDARMMALRACWQTAGSSTPPTLCDSLSLARALQFAIDHKANIINLSLSGPPALLLAKLISIAQSRRATVVAAFDPTLPKGGFPASLPGVIAVADQSLQNVPANVYGAPGRDVPTTQPGGKWYLVNGSSYSVAHVSGLAALVRERRATGPLGLVRTASGSVDACATLLGTTRACDCDCRLAEVAQGKSR